VAPRPPLLRGTRRAPRRASRLSRIGGVPVGEAMPCRRMSVGQPRQSGQLLTQRTSCASRLEESAILRGPSGSTTGGTYRNLPLSSAWRSATCGASFTHSWQSTAYPKFAFVELHDKVVRRTVGDFLRHLVIAIPICNGGPGSPGRAAFLANPATGGNGPVRLSGSPPASTPNWFRL
jgi:hypothetical protein